ncbi:hypothetical protein ACTHPJ_24050 [Paenibacillus amylolyticus]|uniref:hypothetical protein n=1 Tax=Paenibacillus amylolyticus TaxID=1451 RepID=UPI003F7D038B
MILNLNAQKVKAIHSMIELVEELKVFPELKMIDYPNYIEQCNQLKIVLLRLLESKEEITITINAGELYVREHVLPNGETYEFAWSIPLLKKMIKNNENKVIRKKFKIGEVGQFVDSNGLEIDRFDHALRNSNPIYVVDYAPSNLSLMVDGNHRVASRYRTFNDEEMLIPGIYFPAEVHIKSMASNHQKIVFRVLSNTNRIYTYLKTLSEGMKTKKPKLFNMESFL